MNLNINRIKITLVTAAAFFLCCSMSTKCNTPGPSTEVHGIVTDGITGKPLGNLQMEVSDGNFDPHYFTTNADGSYDLKFRPEAAHVSYSLFVSGTLQGNYVSPPFIKVTEGINNDIDYVLYPGINVTVHLVNHTDHGKKQFELSMDDTLSKNPPVGYSPNGVYLTNKVIIDTTFVCQIAHYTHVKCTSTFFGDGTGDINTSHVYYFGNKDTLINVNNP